MQLVSPHAKSEKLLLPKSPPGAGFGAPGGGRSFQEGGKDCWQVPVVCGQAGITAPAPLSHVIVEHSTTNHWRGLFLEAIWVSEWQAGPSGPAGGAAEKLDEGRCASLIESLQHQPADALPRLHQYVCRRWLDLDTSLTGVCYRAPRLNPIGDSKPRFGQGREEGGVRGSIGYDDSRPFVTNLGLGVTGMMGNQLFQLASLLAMPCVGTNQQSAQDSTQCAGASERQVVLPDRDWSGREQERLRLFDLLDLDVPLVPHAFLAARIQDSYQEPHFEFDPEWRMAGCEEGDCGVLLSANRSCLACNANVDLAGRFQSWRYLSHAEQEVRERIKIRAPLKERAARVVAHIRRVAQPQIGREEVRVVSLHVRRGDNVPQERAAIYHDWRQEAPHLYGSLEDTQAPHLLLTPDYIDRAAAWIEQGEWCGHGGSQCVYLIFADTPKDIEWCKKNVPKRLRVFFFCDFVPLVATWDKGAMVKGFGRRVAALTDVLDLAVCPISLNPLVPANLFPAAH